MPDKIVKDALELFRESQDASSHIRQMGEDDVRFARYGEQWPSEVRIQRELDKRPCLTINRLPSFIRQVVNQARAQRPGISVHPVDSGADVETAKVLAGLVRSIERDSMAGLAYDTAIDWAASCGFGFIRVGTDYVGPRSFEQKLTIQRIRNPFSVHWDTSADGAEPWTWRYTFVSEMLPQAVFKKKYPKAKQGGEWPEGRGEDEDVWRTDEAVRVAEYWTREEEPENLVLLSDGRVLTQDDLEKPVEAAGGAPLGVLLSMSGVVPVREREGVRSVVKRRVITALEVLEEEDWCGSTIPIAPVWGEEIIDRGKVYYRSLIRDARDPQAMLNFWRTASTELVALAPKAPWVAAIGTIPQELMPDWVQSGARSIAVLQYDGTQGPAPVRQGFPSVPTGAIQEALNAADDIKSVTGIFDASLGARGNETTGRAIIARQRQGDVSTFHFRDNLDRAIAYVGKVLVECIPKIYGTRETVRIMGEDMRETVVRLAQRAAMAGAMPLQDGEEPVFDLSVGQYDVTVKSGPSFSTQREEAVESMSQIIQSFPAAGPVLGGLVLRNSDWPGAEEAAERLDLLWKAQEQQLRAQIAQGQAMQMQAMAPPMMGGAPPGAAPVDPMTGAPPGALSLSGGV